MSFQDLQSGSGRSHVITIPHHHQQQQEDPSRGIPVAIFRINTALAAFQRLVSSLGTPKDTPDLRLKLHSSRLKIQQLARETSHKLKQATQVDRNAEATKKIAAFKLTREFQYVLKEFEKAQRLAAQRESAYAPSTSHQILPSSSHPHPIQGDTELLRSNEQISILEETRRPGPDIMFVENEIVFNEALIEEREQGIKEIQQQICELNEIFKDLAVLVNEQGYMIDDMNSNIERSRAATAQGTSQLAKASKIQRANSSMKCLGALMFGIILLIVLVVVVA